MALDTKLTTDLIRAHAMSLDGDLSELTKLLDQLTSDSRDYSLSSGGDEAKAAR